MMIQACNPSSQEADHKSKANRGYIVRPYFPVLPLHDEPCLLSTPNPSKFPFNIPTNNNEKFTKMLY
jgi:hypothetical protein